MKRGLLILGLLAGGLSLMQAGKRCVSTVTIASQAEGMEAIHPTVQVYYKTVSGASGEALPRQTSEGLVAKFRGQLQRVAFSFEDPTRGARTGVHCSQPTSSGACGTMVNGAPVQAVSYRYLLTGLAPLALSCNLVAVKPST